MTGGLKDDAMMLGLRGLSGRLEVEGLFEVVGGGID
jgi:hypothetical protein